MSHVVRSRGLVKLAKVGDLVEAYIYYSKVQTIERRLWAYDSYHVQYDVMVELAQWGQNSNNGQGSMGDMIISDYFLISNNSFIAFPVSIKWDVDIHFIWLLLPHRKF